MKTSRREQREARGALQWAELEYMLNFLVPASDIAVAKLSSANTGDQIGLHTVKGR
jgi:hypothetical protein